MPNPAAETYNGIVADLRGKFLASVFPIENELVLIALLHQFSTFEAQRGGIELTAREKVLRRLPFGSLVESAKAAIVWHYSANDKASFLKALAMSLRVRKLLAHEPAWLVPINDEYAGTIPGAPRLRTVGYYIEICDDKYIRTVDDAQIVEWNALADNVRQRAYAFRKWLAEHLPAPQNQAAAAPAPAGLLLRPGSLIPEGSRIYVFDNSQVPSDLALVPGAPLKTRTSESISLQAHIPHTPKS